MKYELCEVSNYGIETTERQSDRLALPRCGVPDTGVPRFFEPVFACLLEAR